jgi:hypothetical protein
MEEEVVVQTGEHLVKLLILQEQVQAEVVAEVLVALRRVILLQALLIPVVVVVVVMPEPVEPVVRVL